MNSIEMNHLYAAIGDFTLKDITIDIPQGAIVGLIGKNGAGKTTLFKTINGTYLQTSGEITINGKQYKTDEKEIRTNLALVYDFYNVNPYAKGKLLKKIYKQSHPKFDEVLFDSLVDRFNIDLKKRITRLSFGMQKKLMMIFAISVHPMVLLLDEPLIGIDPIDKQEFIKLIQEYMEQDQHSIILSSHQVEDIAKIADYIAFIDDGKIILYEDKEQLLDSYRFVKITENDPNQSLLINPVKNSLGVQGIVPTEQATIFTEQTQRASLEQIFVHLCA